MTKKKLKRGNRQLKTISLVSGIVLDVLLLVLAFVMVVNLVGYAGETKFFTDECHHSYIIGLTVEQGRVPGFLPKIYSGQRNIEMPMFHFAGAVFQRLFGEGSLPYLNIFFLVVMLAVMYVLIRVFIHANAARFSLLFLMSSPYIHEFSIVLYIEVLTGFAFFVGLFLLLMAVERRRYSFYVYAGLGVMLMLVTKISGIIVLPFLFMVFVFYGIKYLLRKERLIAVIGPVIVVGVSVAALLIVLFPTTDEPQRVFTRTFMRPLRTLGLHEIFDKKEAEKQLDSEDGKEIMKTQEFWSSFAKGLILSKAYKGYGYLSLAGLVIAIIHVALRLGRSRTLWIFIYFIYAFLVFLYGPAVAPRHFVALLPLAAFLGGYALYDVGEMLSRLVFKEGGGKGTRIAHALSIIGVISFGVLFAFDVRAVKTMPNYRTGLLNGKHVEGLPGRNISSSLLRPIEFIRDNSPEDSMVFTMWAYSTLHYSGRASTWGANVKGMHDIYFVDEPDELYRRCRKAGITHFIVDNNRIFPDEKYVTVVFTKTMVSNLFQLIRDGKAEMQWPVSITSQNRELLDQLPFVAIVPPDLEQKLENVTRYVVFIKTPKGLQPFPEAFFVIKLNVNGGEAEVESEQE